MKTLKRLSFLLLSALFLTPFAACSDDDDNDSAISTDPIELIGGDNRIAEIHESEIYNGDSYDGDITYITYNDDNRVIKTVTGSETETFTYNSAGQLTGYDYTDEDYPDDDSSVEISWSGSTATVEGTEDGMAYESKFIFNSAMQLKKVEDYYTFEGQSILFEYSDYTWSDNNLTKVVSYTYSNDFDLVSTPKSKASLLKPAIKINPDQLLLKSSDEMSVYYEEAYVYDSKSNPLRVYPVAPFLDPALFSANNITKMTETWIYDGEEESDVSEYTYTYNEDDMPETQTASDQGYGSYVNTYIYESFE
ncbi:hypothetical protein ACT3CD_02445 [Geofilum sp. OHC36d9]|uniref:hypothetical protein n=1 Tax=Geofilum sp. OHC36d9 TaxID=3458413 RepID=UPI0040337D9E